MEGRAALYSLGFLLRRATAVLLDINEWELRVGRSAQGNVVGQVFLSDALENGAGYCSQFATPAAIERLLRFMSDPAITLLAPMVATLTNAGLHVTAVCVTTAILHGTTFSIGASLLMWRDSHLMVTCPLILPRPTGRRPFRWAWRVNP